MGPLSVSRDAQVTMLTLSRVQRANALDHELVEALHAALDLAFSDGTRLLVLTGAGENFCGGFDFGGFESASNAELCWRFVRIEQLLQKLAHAPIDTLALAQGGAFGAGADLLAACTQRVAGDNLRVRMPGWKFGLALGTRRLAALIGAEKAREVLAEATIWSASEALAAGLIGRISAPAQWPEDVAAATRTATSLAASARVRLAHLTRDDTRAADMAALVESLTEGDLRARIAKFRAQR
ncbi:MAG: enoyl-CoA hydratase/isomerase family protein [Burkholderiales bacterium]|nr:enoyl-CoA hydratase/isomerase family protein [Burkholderiales bacterium]